MKKTRQPNTPYLVFLSLFFTLTLATQTTGSVNCQTGSLRYPFGFSDGYPIRFNCSKKTGDAEIGEFAVQEVTNSSIYVEIPPVCKRAIRKIEQLFSENFAPSSLQNIFLFQECNQSLSDCSIGREFLQDRLNLSTCNSNMTCMDGGTDITADVIRVVDVVNGSGCTYWVSSISKPEGLFKFGILRLDWWLKERCSNTTCSANAACTDVKLADGSFGHRCTCLQGFSGNAFIVPGGCRSGSLVKRLKPIRKVVGSVAGVVLFVILLSLFLCFLRKRGKLRMSQQNLKSLIPLKHYTYAQVKRITQSFAEVIGRGGFGIVYRGTLSDGCMVAVKVLKDSKGNGEDFLNEVASMSQTSHLNIVSLLGFCSEGSKRAIIYEYLGNGSLDKFISGKTSMNLDWTTLYQIALGVARGLEYLHHGCKTRIVHFDIKPQNILLDDNFCPKVSDFGLAKLCGRKESILSLLDTRGTIGYIAPEMISRVYGNVSHKSDVYSYGMLVLEMIGTRNKERAHQDYASYESSIYFPEWVYRDLEAGKSRRLIESGITNETDQLAKKMTLVGLWCIQSSPLDRPPMNKVLEMMEGSLEALEVPPRPVLQHIPVAPLQESSTLSEDISG